MNRIDCIFVVHFCPWFLRQITSFENQITLFEVEKLLILKTNLVTDFSDDNEIDLLIWYSVNLYFKLKTVFLDYFFMKLFIYLWNISVCLTYSRTFLNIVFCITCVGKCLFLDYKMKNTKYNIIEIVLKFTRKIVERGQIDPLIHKYMTAHFPGMRCKSIE